MVRRISLAQCTLDISHPHFLKIFETLAQGHPDAMDALVAVKAKIEADMMSCNRVVQPMPKFPECQGVIWKYDWAPPSVKGSTRKAWRLVIHAYDVKATPKQLRAIACYSKSDEAKLSLKALAGHLSSANVVCS